MGWLGLAFLALGEYTAPSCSNMLSKYADTQYIKNTDSTLTLKNEQFNDTYAIPKHTHKTVYGRELMASFC